MNPVKKNRFKQQIQAGQTQIGLWAGLANAYTLEIMASSTRFDWCLIDAEHAPNTVPTVLAQLQTLATYPMQPVVRPPVGDEVLIKQYLDIGAQTLLVPMVESAAQAENLVKAMRYPPEGIRGVGSALARASLWNTTEDYLNACNAEMCLLVQVENKAGFENIAAIAAVDGVDGVFIGPADLSASFGYRGNPQAPEMQARIKEALGVIKAAGKAAGILYGNPEKAQEYIAMGFDFVAVGVDTTLFGKACQQLATRFERGLDDAPAAENSASDVY